MQGQSDSYDQNLVTKVVAGDRRAFTQLVEPLIPVLMSTAQRMLGVRDEAEDAVQNALASAWIARAQIDPTRPILPFLTTITLNKCRDKLRRKKAARFLGFGTVAMPELAVDLSPSPEAEAVDRQLLQKTHAEIQRLPLRLREALILVAIDGQSQNEAAVLLGISEKALEALVYRARKRLREKILFE
ncbi:RNA polymerase [Erythrobacter sp. QSSC1-22B]|uniref:RNA polymerase sigma factor n=1 Tax=Erythrobacter sp. QSSC1-22B TaxID=1860125 RepID=UPI00080503F7|nr:RNA polymerase sigma factor [Erythrobacter sp. QSSC1-22B]OBX18950.1 RNA polymerase [Erythrobacter sp. QSSC1-22B]